MFGLERILGQVKGGLVFDFPPLPSLHRLMRAADTLLVDKRFGFLAGAEPFVGIGILGFGNRLGLGHHHGGGCGNIALCHRFRCRLWGG
ncbi:MAG: hypothetical protein B7Z71_03880 [Acidocella sp. 21-58-7]|nr:MAG: hypothetical protein B7Z71_03880 [Acidocella sp. 21-58-7]